MTLSHIINDLKSVAGWPEYSYSWLERELAGVGMLVEARGDRIHAVVVGMHTRIGTTYADFSRCQAPCGAHGLPPSPKFATPRPCLTFIVVTRDENVFTRDETLSPETGEA